MLGKSRATLSASAMPSMIGMRTSVSRRSKLSLLARQHVERFAAVGRGLDLVAVHRQRARTHGA